MSTQNQLENRLISGKAPISICFMRNKLPLAIWESLNSPRVSQKIAAIRFGDELCKAPRFAEYRVPPCNVRASRNGVGAAAKG